LFAPLFFNNLTLVLDNFFAHQTRAIEAFSEILHKFT
jgi:hypothetical protein